MHKRYKILLFLVVGVLSLYFVYRKVNSSSINLNTRFYIGQPIDSFNGVEVYYNGMVGHTGGRNVSADGYNIGMKYQCVEFVKRYYYERYGHKMPDAYGNAKDFFDGELADSGFNAKRGLTQYRAGSRYKPVAEDLIIFKGHTSNPYGHVAIVTNADDTSVSIIQQNPGPFGKSRVSFKMGFTGAVWRIDNELALGWLRMEPQDSTGLYINAQLPDTARL
jgi:surface antigen